ncbi:MAG: hypothetical protein AMS15_09175 [Planctomycetes bacterium DG_23]|nr:MAG: hypothetical protein AMS15_09175 [Planctomycetes bacterium DG_23]
MKKALALSLLLLASCGLAFAEEECWTLEFESQIPRRMVIANSSGESKVYWYMLYKVTNNTAAEHFFIPDISIETETKKIYLDSLYPDPEWAVERRKGKKFLNMAEMIGKIKPGETKEGIALFPQIDPAADELRLVVMGITNEFKIEKFEAGTYIGKVCRHRALVVTHKRPGDEHNPHMKRVYFYGRTWDWR